ncbi:hypothetical protein ACFSBG_10605 [Georgenia yuyongxinii]|nr:hypothetical protein [Georgenia yuyongxinii]
MTAALAPALRTKIVEDLRSRLEDLGDLERFVAAVAASLEANR